MACLSLVFSSQVIDADKDDLHADTNSKDSSSIIYGGGWPYNSEKNSLSTDGFAPISLEIPLVNVIKTVLIN